MEEKIKQISKIEIYKKQVDELNKMLSKVEFDNNGFISILFTSIENTRRYEYIINSEELNIKIANTIKELVKSESGLLQAKLESLIK